MARKPALLTVDDDAAVLNAVQRDLRHHYGDRYRVVSAESADAALAALERLRERHDPVALLLADQRMPGTTGTQFLERAKALYPAAKRVLLTAYADTNAAIDAINTVQVDHYLLKPWDPPEERLYPVLDELLDDWQAGYRPPFEGVRVVGHRWGASSHDLRDFLSRNGVPYLWLDVERDAEARRLIAETGADATRLPLVLFPDGSSLVQPANAEVAGKIGLRTHTETPFYDLIIVGGGPAGLAAAVYGASEGLGTVLIERDAPGGQAVLSSRIENYLGFPVGLSGGDLARRAVAQASRFGVEIVSTQEATGLRVDGLNRYVTLSGGGELSCHALMITTGVSYRRLDAPGVERLTGAGIFYGSATTEAVSCTGEDVFIVGGANSAGQAAIYLARFARRITILVRGSSLGEMMSSYLVEQIAGTENIVVEPHSQVVEALGEEKLEALIVTNTETGSTQTVPAAALFIFIGAAPRTDWVGSVVQRDSQGFILTGPDLLVDGRRPKGWQLDRDPYLLEASVPGVFVAGDVRHGSVKRIASAVGEGAVGVQLIHQYLSQM